MRTTSPAVIVVLAVVGVSWSSRSVSRAIERPTASLAALYAAQALPEIDIQYADYAHWQRQWMDEASLAPLRARVATLTSGQQSSAWVFAFSPRGL